MRSGARVSGGTQAIRLSARALHELPARVHTPAYDRGQVATGVVHMSVGGFHRAHQAMYHDELLAAGAPDWGICGIGVLPGDRAMRDALTAQDGLYTLVERAGDGTSRARVIGSLTEYLLTPDDPEAVIEKLAAPATRVVSMTITEGGYSIHPLTGELDPDLPDIAHDLTPGAVPRSAFGLMAEALDRRRKRGLAPYTVMSCDNLEANGDLTRATLTAFARLRDPGLAEWLEEEGRFPNSMVDRITPQTTDADRADVRERFGIEDRWPVVCEPYVQWVLEDSFTLGRPPYEDVGVQVVDDVRPYELMKLRLLNAGHQALGYFAHLCGYRFVHEAAQDPLLRTFLLGYMDEEATPTLEPVPGVDLDAYKQTLIERFANAGVADTVARLCAESSDRIPKWLLPVIRAQLETGGELRRSAAVVASWARYAEGVDEQGRPIEVRDRLRDSLTAAARRQRQDPTAFIEHRDLFGTLADEPRFVEAYVSALDLLHRHGARATLEHAVRSS